jgi:SAM-dependent methyltransferase
MNLQIVKDYYGKTLTSSADLKTDACCAPDDGPAFIRHLIANVHEEVRAKYYGCGLIAPLELAGACVLDLGCGSGRDAYALSQLVGSEGQVVGVDMTPEQLAVARRHLEWHARKFGFKRSNVRFVEGYIENLCALDLEPASFDVIISNCVINLSPDKSAVLRGVFDLLKPGGELYFADVYADRRLPERIKRDPVLVGECLGGALYWNDFLTLARAAGFRDPRLVADRAVAVTDDSIAANLAPAKFFSATYRLFKLDGLEPLCEDYGQAVVYQGGIAHAEELFVLDKHHRIERGKAFPVCGNTWRMLKETRFAPHFAFVGDFSTHYGLFAGCGAAVPFDTADSAGGTCC